MRAFRRAPSGRAAILALSALGLLVLLAIAAFAWRAWTRAPFADAVAALETQGPEAALAILDLAQERPGLEGAEAELRAICLLRLGLLEQAGLAFDAAAAEGGAGKDRPRDLGPCAQDLLAEGREDALLPLADYARRVLDPLPADVMAHEGFGKHARGDLAGARESYRAALDAGLSGELASTVEAQLGRAAEEARSGRIPVVFARGGEVLAWRDARTRELVAGPELQALLGGASLESLPGIGPGDLDGRLELSLDAALQARAARLFRSETGAFVALSVPGGEILAAASEPQPATPLAPFDARFQPGSTLKILTMAAWLEAGKSDDAVVPYDCRGNELVLDGEIAYDWASHGRLVSLEHALSQSCNTVFARMGLGLGEQRLREALRPLGFGASLDAESGPHDGEGFALASGVRWSTGALAAGPLGERRLARTAMGLDETQVSALQAAAMGLVFASGGELSPPRLVRRRMNVTGAPLPDGEGAGTAPLRIYSAATAARVARAMGTVVTDPDGTGRGAAAAGVPVSLKTGTTGGDGKPLSSGFVGFLPSNSPELAFALFTRESGRSLDVSRRVLGPFLKDAWSARAASLPGN